MSRILLVTSSYPRWKDDDVTGRFMQDIAQAMGTQNEVTVLAPWTKTSAKRENLEGVEVVRHRQTLFGIEFAYGDGLLPNIKKAPWKILFLPCFFLHQLLAIALLARAQKIEILNPHWMIPQGFLCAVYKRLFNSKIKIIAYSHGTDLLGLNGLIGTAIKKFTLRSVDRLFVTNDALAEKARELGFTGLIHVSPMGVDTKMFTPEKRSAAIKEKYAADKLIVYAGALIETKGLLELVKAFSVVAGKYPKAKLVMIGKGSLKPALNSLASGLGIDDLVHFPGVMAHRELSEHLAAADAFALPSYSEGFSMIVAEAMSSGVPVVMTEGIGIAHTLKGKGLLIETPLKNADALAANLLRALEKPQVDLPGARKFVEDQLSWTVLGKRINDFIAG